jgi:hypothetical protein
MRPLSDVGRQTERYQRWMDSVPAMLLLQVSYRIVLGCSDDTSLQTYIVLRLDNTLKKVTILKKQHKKAQNTIISSTLFQGLPMTSRQKNNWNPLLNTELKRLSGLHKALAVAFSGCAHRASCVAPVVDRLGRPPHPYHSFATRVRIPPESQRCDACDRVHLHLNAIQKHCPMRCPVTDGKYIWCCRNAEGCFEF